MPITVAGCGALGSLLAARLIEGGAELQVYQREGEQLNALKENGITIERDRTGKRTNFGLSAISSQTRDLEPSSLIVVLVKSHATELLSPLKELLKPKGVALTLQNGLGNMEKLVSIFGKYRVGAGIDTYGAYRIAPGVIGWGGDGFIRLGSAVPGHSIKWVADLLAEKGLNVAYREDPKPDLWKKLAINAMVNTASALTGMKNGELLDYPLMLDLMRHLGRESVSAAKRAGVEIDFEELWEMHLNSLKRTGNNKTSMLQDFESGRPSEIDAISGSVLQYARSGSEYPYTRSVHAMLKSMETHRTRKGNDQ